MRSCWAEYDSDGRVIRIFRTHKAAVLNPAWETGHVLETPRADAVESIRRQVFERAGYKCETCGDRVTWDSGHLHEKHHRGKGGEVSVENGQCLCYNCHLNDPIVGHGKRKPQFSKSTGMASE